MVEYKKDKIMMMFTKKVIQKTTISKWCKCCQSKNSMMTVLIIKGMTSLLKYMNFI